MKKDLMILSILGLVVGVVVVPFAFAEQAVDGRAGRAEVRFMQGMSVHQQTAVDLATDCLTKATTQDMLDFCQNVIDNQTPEIDTLHGWLLNWYNIDDANSDTNTASSTMPLVMSGLEGLDGRDYEIAWLETMIDHHDDAVHMSTRLLEQAEHKPLRDLAQKIVVDQSAEIEQMEVIIHQLETS